MKRKAGERNLVKRTKRQKPKRGDVKKELVEIRSRIMSMR